MQKKLRLEKRGGRIYEQNKPTDPKVRAEGGAGDVSGARGEIPLQPVEQPMVVGVHF